MKILATVLAVIAALTLALAGYEYRELERLRAGALTPQDRIRLMQAAWDAQKEIKTLRDRLVAAHPDAGAAAAAGGRDKAIPLGTIAADYLQRMEDPEVRRLMDLQRVAGINRQYGAFFRDAKLTPQQIERFRDLMLERQRTQSDVISAAAQQGINPMNDPEELQRMVRSAQGEIDQQMQSALAADQWTQFQDYQQAERQRAVVSQVAADLSFTDAPLSDGQRQQLQQAIAATNSAGGSTINEKTLAAAQSFLSPAQYQALQNAQQLQQAGTQLGSLMSARR